MSGFFGLINNILVDIVHNWIEFQDLIKVDTACCNKKARVRFLDILSRNILDCSLECDFSKPLQWGQIRQVLVIFHNFKISASSMIHKKLLEHAAFIVSLTIKMSKCDCDDLNLISHLSLWFQNLKSLKFTDFVPNYDNILKIDPNILNQLTTLHLQGVYKYSFSCGERGYEENHYPYTQFLISLARCCPHLDDVSLLVHYQHMKVNKMCSAFLSRLQHLKRLEICVKSQFSDKDLQLIVNSCHSTIEKLQFWIQDSDATHLTPQHIVCVIQQCPQLREFTVCYKNMFIRERNSDGSPKQCRPITFNTDNDHILFCWKQLPDRDINKSNIDITLRTMSFRSYDDQLIMFILSAFRVVQRLTLIHLIYDLHLYFLVNKIEVCELILYKCCHYDVMERFKKLAIENQLFDTWGQPIDMMCYVHRLSSRVESLTLYNIGELHSPEDILILNPNLKHVHFVDCLYIDTGKLMQWWEKSDKTVTNTFSTNSDKKAVFTRLHNWFSGV